MDKLRRSRYLDKTGYIIKSIPLAEKVLPQPNEIETNALYYLLLTSIESALDLVAMMVKDSSKIPKGDRHNIQLLKELGFINETTADELSLCNGLRNVLVHRYNGIDKLIVLESVPNVLTTLNEFLKDVEAYLDEFE